MNKQIIKQKPTFIADFYEQEAWAKNLLVCGIDEAGRGCFAGPVVVAAAILKPGCTHKLLKDSKILTKAQRDEAFEWIINHAWFNVCLGTPQDIELYNILQTTKNKMLQSFINLIEQEKNILPNIKYLLIDAVNLTIPASYKSNTMDCLAFPFGESRSISIAAASIIAKVTRDKLMEHMHTLFPAYKFDEHKGYGTSLHQTQLLAFGKSIIHRPSFLKKIESKTEQHQLSIG